MMTKQKRKKAKRLSQHHICPSSRGGSDHESNIVYINSKAHEKLHSLFANMTPVESIEYLVRYFWKGNWDFVKNALERRDG